MSTPIPIDIWSDVVCPWCYIGKRHLEAGLAQLGDDAPEVEITYHSYELSPDTPDNYSGTQAELLARKGYAPEQVEQMTQRIVHVAKDAGLDYKPDIWHPAKTLKAHELLHFAKAHGRQNELKERLMKAYFVEGGHVGDIDELVGYAVDAGLDADQARHALTDSTYADAVQADIAQAQAYGITGVPFFIFDGKYGVSGAQPADVFAQVLTQVHAERTS